MRKRKPRGQQKNTCSKCNNPLEENRVGKQRYCLNCHNEFMRLTRPKHSELTDQQRKKANCRSYLHTYIKRGKIKKGKCIVCGSEKVEAHHKDYSKPLEVVWYCPEHHTELHKKNS